MLDEKGDDLYKPVEHDSMVKCKNINLSFEGKLVFKDLNINVNKGTHLCISGVSGKGKSTFLKMLQAYVLPDKGSIEINGNSLSSENIKTIRRSMVWIPQDINLPVENAYELASMMNLETDNGNISNIMEKLGLEADILHRSFSKISGGQKQRAIIAICLALNKEIVLMDEPTASLDDKSIKLLINTIKELKGTTVVSASHNKLWLQGADQIFEI